MDCFIKKYIIHEIYYLVRGHLSKADKVDVFEDPCKEAEETYANIL